MRRTKNMQDLNNKNRVLFDRDKNISWLGQFTLKPYYQSTCIYNEPTLF